MQRGGGELFDVELPRTLVTTLRDHFQYVHVDRDESFFALDMQLPTTLELARLRTLAQMCLVRLASIAPKTSHRFS